MNTTLVVLRSTTHYYATEHLELERLLWCCVVVGNGGGYRVHGQQAPTLTAKTGSGGLVRAGTR